MLKKILFRIGVTLVVIAIMVYIAFQLSPYPMAMIIRYVFNREAVKTNEALKKHVPSGVFEFTDIQYDEKDDDSKLDVYFPATVTDSTLLPLIVWIHGGGLISGDKSQVSNYCKILAAYGFVVAAIDYSIAPESVYPKPLFQTNTALAFLMSQSEKFHINKNKVFLAGDSGGAQIASQTGNIIYNSNYAGLMNINPSINKKQLLGLILFCGIYDLKNIDMSGDYASFFKTVLWAYSGTKKFESDTFFQTASVFHFVEADFPPCFISAGNGDPLLQQSLMLAAKLKDLKIEHDTLFFPNNSEPALPHEYQFNLDTEAGQMALAKTLEFLDVKSKIGIRAF